MKNFVFNPLFDKSPAGTCKEKTCVTYRLKVSKFISFEKAFFVVHKDGNCEEFCEMEREFTDERYIHLKTQKTFNEVGHFWYHFEVKTRENYFKLIKSETLDCVESKADCDFLQLVTEKDSVVDESFRKGIIYHIFVDRFCKFGEVKARKGLHLIKDWNQKIELEYNNQGERCNKNCYGGNLEGVIEKLPYLKELNVSTIYLSPIFEANSSHKYNTANYEKIDSMFGNKETLKKLITSAKKLNINIILDGVFNHTGSDSVYFNKFGTYKNKGAYQSKKSPYYSWYDFSNYPDEYSAWWGVKSLPQTNENSSFFDYISGKDGIIETFMSLGLGGFRLDVADELTNKFLTAISNAVKRKNPKGMVVGEVWEDASSKISYGERKNYFLGNSLDSVTNYPMKNAILEFVKTGNVNSFVCVVSMIKDQYPVSVQHNLMNILDTHDTMRAITFLGKEKQSLCEEDGSYTLTEDEFKRGKELLKIASLIQYTVLGIPTVFYGDEAGVQGTKDPFCRKTYPWGKEDKDLVEWYKKLGKIRENKVFVNGEMNIIFAKDGVLVYERKSGKTNALILVNLSKKDFEFSLNKKYTNFFSNEKMQGNIVLKEKDYLLLI